MKKLTYTIRKFINPDIKVGDRIYVIDGSGFTIVTDEVDENKIDSYFIINSYPHITGIDEVLCKIIGTVVEINITDKICPRGTINCYLQDIVVSLGNAKFRTCSDFVKKIKSKKS